jgi:hypothetical protein
VYFESLIILPIVSVFILISVFRPPSFNPTCALFQKPDIIWIIANNILVETDTII